LHQTQQSPIVSGLCAWKIPHIFELSYLVLNKVDSKLIIRYAIKQLFKLTLATKQVVSTEASNKGDKKQSMKGDKSSNSKHSGS
jgi:hypothetical protein